MDTPFISGGRAPGQVIYTFFYSAPMMLTAISTARGDPALAIQRKSTVTSRRVRLPSQHAPDINRFRQPRVERRRCRADAPAARTVPTP